LDRSSGSLCQTRQGLGRENPGELIVRRTVLVLAAAALCAAPAAGCSDHKAKPAASATTAASTSTAATPDAVARLATAKNYLSSVSDLRVKGTNASNQPGGALSMDYAYRGQNSTGTIAYSGADFELRSVAGVTYLKPSEKFWRQLAPAQAGVIISQIGG